MARVHASHGAKAMDVSLNDVQRTATAVGVATRQQGVAPAMRVIAESLV
jgi:hypothetical protein